MALIDEIRQIAQSKESYNPGAISGTPIQRAPRRLPNVQLPTPQRPPAGGVVGVPRPDVSGGNNLADELKDIIRTGRARTPIEKIDSGDSAWDDLRGGIGGAFGKIIEVVDTPRSFAVSGVNQLTDMAAGEGFDSDEFRDDAWRNIGFGEVVEKSFGDDMPWWSKVAMGVAGDVGLDPLSYVGAGAVAQGAKAIGRNAAGRLALSELDNALIQGSRTGLASEVVTQAAKRSIVDDGVERLAREAGQRGRGAFTTQGLKRAGVDRELVENLGLQTGFGTRVGLGSGAQAVGFNVPGTRVLAEAAENIKGSIKKLSGSNTNKANRLIRAIGSSNEYGERLMRSEILAGSQNAAGQARALAALRASRREASLWFSQTMDQVNRNIPEFPSMDEDQLRAVTNMLESGVDDPVANKVRDFYTEVGRFLQENGVEFGWRDNYVNHSLTPKALRDLRNGDSRLVKDGWNKSEAFQNERIVEGTIDEINRRYRDLGFDYDVLESDPTVLMTKYLSQAERALTRQGAKNKLADFGAASLIPERVDDAKVAAERAAKGAELDDLARLEGEQLRSSNVVRQGQLREAAETLSERRRTVAGQVLDFERQVDEAGRRVSDLQSRIAVREGELAGLEVAARHWEQVAKKARGGAKGHATRKLKAALERRAKVTAEVAGLRRRLGDAPTPETFRIERDALKAQYDQISEEVNQLRQARAELNDPTLDAAVDRVPRENLAEINERIRGVREKLLTETSEMSDAAAAYVWAGVDADTAVGRLQNVLNKIDESAMEIAKAPAPGPRGAANAAEIAARREIRDELRSRTQTVMKALQDIKDPNHGALAKIEAQAIAHDAEALKIRYRASDVKKRIDVLNDPEFREYMIKVAEDGMTKLNDDLQVPAFLDQALDTTKRLRDPGEAAGLIRMYDQFQNWWKSWATASPGFIFRNGYSGIFGIWLDRGVGAAKSLSEFRGYMNQIKKGGIEQADAWAVKKYGPEQAQMFHDGMLAAHGSGIGRTVNEVQAQLIGHKRKKLSLGANSAAPGWVRDRSQDLETWMRGSHAYDVIKSGGSIQAAEDAVHKFHFNYRDISEFDQMAKRVIPFWMFFSRNMALQADVWATMPHKLNRSYFNLKRNLELQADPDEVVPEYYGEIGAVQTPVGEPGGGAWYFTPDLPSLRFRDDVSNVLEAPTNPLALLADASPVAKVGAEALANRQAFTGIPFKNRLYDYDDEGNVIGREAPLPFQIPGVDRLADMLPGTQYQDGRLLMQDNTQTALEGLAPVLGRVTRLLPNQPRYQERWGQSVGSFLGAPIRQNTEGSIEGELYRRQKALEDAQYQEAIRQLVAGL